MVNIRASADAEAPDSAALALFQRDWMIYRKMVDHDYLFHRGAYGALRRYLVEEVDRPFRFLDIACGDASASVGALKGTKVAHYHGIDLSAPALKLAAEELAALDCPVDLDRRDFYAALNDRPEPADVAWVGLSLHHFQPPEKLKLMRAVRGVVGAGGAFLLYENTSPDGEDRDGWLRRWDLQRPTWHAFTDADWQALWDHVHTADFPETDSTWRGIARDAGFGTVRQLFRSPTDLFRLYCVTA
jgi:ubiquinone/menaquinone biosynthesis C-methylase UbiE